MRRHAKAPSAGSTEGNARPLALASLLAALLVLGSAVAAFAFDTHTNQGTLDGSGAPQGLQFLSGLAIDEGSSDLYAVDGFGAGAPVESTGAVHRFDSSGSYQGTFDGQGTPQGSLEITFSAADVAIDASGGLSDGNVYVTDTNHNLIGAFDSAGSLIAGFATGGQIDGSDTPIGSLASPCGLAVDQANGDLYIADSGHNRIWIYDETGKYIDRISDSSLNGPCGLALDSTGDLYVQNQGAANVVKFERAGPTAFDFKGVVDSNSPTDVATNSANDDVFVDNGSVVTEYDSSGAQLTQFGQGTISDSHGIAVDGTSGKVYVADGSTLRVFGPSVILPDVSTGEATEVTGVSARVSGTVDPAGGPEADCSFEYGTDESYGQSAACEPVGPFASVNEVSAELAGLTPGITYHYRIVSANADGTSEGEGRTFKAAEAPLIDRTYVINVHAMAADLNAWIDPNGTDTTYYFEWSTADCASNPCESTAVGDIGSADVPGVYEPGSFFTKADPVATHHINNLEPGTTYHYRVIADSAAGTSTGPDRIFKTFPLATPTQLPDSRAYEMVSPVAKNGGNIGTNPWQTVSSTDGNAVTFMSSAAFADTGGLPAVSDYVAQRRSDGWTTHGLTANQPFGTFPLPSFAANETKYTGFFTDDLSKGVEISHLPLTNAPNVAETINLYRRDNLLSGTGPNPDDGASYQLLSDSVAPVPNQQGFGYQRYTDIAATSGDLEMVTYESWNNLTQDTVDHSLDTSLSKLYESDHGVQRLAGILPSGEPADSSIAGGGIIRSAVTSGESRTQHMVSADGSKAFFTANPAFCGGDVARKGCGNLYMRLDGSTTIQLNVSEKTNGAGIGGTDPGGPRPEDTQLWDASKDGSKVFFTTPEELTNDDSNGGNDVYMYDATKPASDPNNLSLLSVDSNLSDGDGCGCGDVIGASEDGSYVYFFGNGSKLAAGQILDAGYGKLIYVWHLGVIRAIGYAEASGPNGWGGSSFGTDYFYEYRMSPSGKYLVINTINLRTSELVGYENIPTHPGGMCYGKCRELYLYSYDVDKLACMSCDPTGAVPNITGALAQESSPDLPVAQVGVVRDTTAVSQPTQYRTRAVTDDGLAFFSSMEQLVPQDINGHWDAYEYDSTSDELHLISTGQCNCNSFFVEASPDSKNVFFTTGQQLVRIDRDNLVDLYDARVDGGIAAQNALPPFQCQGDACQPAAVAPNDATPSSATSKGPGNPKVTKKRPGKRKHKSKRRRHQRAASHNRGGAK